MHVYMYIFIYKGINIYIYMYIYIYIYKYIFIYIYFFRCMYVCIFVYIGTLQHFETIFVAQKSSLDLRNRFHAKTKSLFKIFQGLSLYSNFKPC